MLVCHLNGSAHNNVSSQNRTDPSNPTNVIGDMFDVVEGGIDQLLSEPSSCNRPEKLRTG